MTREQVMAMTDEELRVKAAELRGWERSTGKMAELLPWKDPQGVSRLDLPDYPNDIAAAWGLMDDAVEYAVYFPGDRGKDDVWCRMTLRDRGCGEKSGDCPGDLSVFRALTRAFILAMEPDDA